MASFPDYGFKLVVIEQLLQNGSFIKDLELLKSMPRIKIRLDGEECYGETIPEVDSFFRNLELTEDDLDNVKELWFDGGHEIYQLIKPFWSGEEDDFDILSVDGFEQLKNLQKAHQVSMISDDQFNRFRVAGIECD